MRPLSDDDLELWLSRYLDNELEAAEKDAVAAKIRDNPRWRSEFERMKADNKIVGRTTRKFFAIDDGFTRNVVQKLKPAQKAASVKATKPHVSHRIRVIRRSHRRVSSLPLGLAATVVLALGAGLGWKALQQNRVTEEGGTKTLASVTITENVRNIDWPDGTRVIARRGAVIQTIDDRTLSLRGEAYFHVAKSPRPFTVISGKHKAQALGTQFEVVAGSEGARVRVAEGRVRVSTSESHAVEARGGTEVLANLQTRSFDPREVSAKWKQSEEPVAPWSQIGGSAAHSGTTPLVGPASLVGKREAFYAFPKDIEAPITGAVISPSNRAYVIVQAGSETRLMELKLSDSNRAWKTCSVNTASHLIPPAITPTGLVVMATIDGVVNAYDPIAEKMAWSQKQRGRVLGLCAAADELVYVSTSAGITAIDALTGQTHWRCDSALDLQGPITVLPSGLICAPSEHGHVYIVDQSARIIKTYSWPHSLTPPAVAIPPVAADGDKIWLTSGDGYVGKMSLDDGSVSEKYFGWQLRCSPIASGLLGVGNLMMHFDQPAAVTAPAEDTLVTLVQDGRNEIFAGYRRGVLHIPADSPAAAMARMKGPDFSSVSAGDIVKNGLAVTSGKLVVTTSRGVQIFE